MKAKVTVPTGHEATVAFADNSQYQEIEVWQGDKHVKTLRKDGDVASITPKPNRNEYHRVNMRKWRAAKKAAKVNANVLTGPLN